MILNLHPRRLLTALGLATVLTGTAFAAPAPRPLDLATTAGFTRTCASLPPGAAQLANDDERIAWAVCRDVDLARRVATWLSQGSRAYTGGKASPEQLKAEVEKKLDVVRADLRRTRLTLERVDLKQRTSLRLAPGQWQVDLDGDGQIETWEANFFALPRKQGGEPQFALPSNDPGHYASRYNAEAQIRIDQADVLWAVSYHQFIEGLLANLRAFDLNVRNFQVTLARPALLRDAHQLIGQGLATSEQLRQAVLAETDDDQEWLGHPGQTSSAFPIPLEAADFETWGQVIAQMRSLWQGRSLMPTTRGGRGLLAELAPVCEPGEGLDLARLYLQPPPAGTAVKLGQLRTLGQGACRAVDAGHPLSDLPRWLERSRSGQASGTQMLRYLYWVN